MTRDDIIRMAREAGFQTGTVAYESGVGGMPYATPIATSTCLPELERFAALVAAAEREACIDLVSFYGGPVDLEAAIRARGNA